MQLIIEPEIKVKSTIFRPHSPTPNEIFPKYVSLLFLDVRKRQKKTNSSLKSCTANLWWNFAFWQLLTNVFDFLSNAKFGHIGFKLGFPTFFVYASFIYNLYFIAQHGQETSQRTVSQSSSNSNNGQQTVSLNLSNNANQQNVTNRPNSQAPLPSQVNKNWIFG